MPTTYTDYISKVQDDVLDQIKEAQDVSLKSFASLREMSASYPTMPAMPKLDGFPTPSEVIEQSFEFAEKFLELRKAYTLKVVDLIETAQKQFADAARTTAKTAKHNN
jgi:geranylgeranyl pyrophosphate synthase